MDKSWMEKGRSGRVYIRGLLGFIRFVQENIPRGCQNVKCPCMDCMNRQPPVPFSVMEKHLKSKGLDRGYTDWVYHGEMRQLPVVRETPPVYPATTSFGE